MRKTIRIINLLILSFIFGSCKDTHIENSVQNKPNDTEQTISKPAIALTFDDGPNMTISIKILDALEERGLVATYFVIGQNIDEQTEEVMRRAYELGCEYAPHSWDWNLSSTKNKDENMETITKTNDKIIEILGEEARSAFHRSHGEPGDEAIEAAKELGYPIISGLLTNDWNPATTPQNIFESIVSNVEDGSIIALHDGYFSTATAEAIGDILDALIETGYQFLTLSELFERRGTAIEPGKIYYSGSR